MIRLKSVGVEEATEIYALMTQHFIEDERRDLADFLQAIRRPQYTMYGLWQNGVRVGYAGIWTLNGMFFMEHFAVVQEYRGRGVGSACLQTLLQRFHSMVLEVEHPTGETEKRRIAFYERNGFVREPFDYLQPSYHGGEPLSLELMSYPSHLPDDSIVDEIYATVYMTTRKNNR